MHVRPRLTRGARRLVVAAGALLACAGLITAGHAPARAATPRSAASAAGVLDIPISFQVRNVNRSAVACPADGRTYTVRGSLVEPPEARQSPRALDAVTLYLHGLSFGKFFWDFDAVSGYDDAVNQARAGQSSVIIDRLGYGASGKPAGKSICAGSRADIAHQVVADLRSGHYVLGGHGGTRFTQVFLAGHSYGGQIGEIEAYSFGDIDGLIVISYTDTGQTALTNKSGAYAAKVCAAGGKRVYPGGPGGYAPFGPPSGAPAALFHDVDPAVLAAVKPLLSVDPCGDDASFAGATRVDLTHVSRIRVPVLLIQGGADALFDVAAQPSQAALFAGARTVTTDVVPDSGHALTLERTHNTFAADVRDWLQLREATWYRS